MMKKRERLSKKQVLILCVSLAVFFTLFTIFISYLHSLDADQYGTFGDTLVTSDFEYTFHENYTCTVSAYGDLIFIVPVTIKNIGYKSGVSRSAITVYNPNGTKIVGGPLNGYSAVSFNYDLELELGNSRYNGTGEIRSGGTTETTMCFLYEGDGEYFIDLYSGTSGRTVGAHLDIVFR